MKIGCIADLQFAEYANLSRWTRGGITSRLQDIHDAVVWAADTATKKGCKRMVVAGDVHDDRVSIALPVLHVAAKALAHAADAMPLDIVAGNHDSYLRDSSITSLSAFRHDRITVHTTLGARGELGFVAWHDSAKRIASRVSKVLALKAKYLFGHGLVVGSVPGGGGLDPKIFQPQQFKRVLLGDVHTPYRVSDTFQYIGAPLWFDYRDANDPKRGMVILDTDSNTIEYIKNPVSPQFILADHPEDVCDVRERDYVRVVSDKVDRKTVKRLRKQSCWVEDYVPDVKTEPVRVRFDDSKDHAAVLKQYVAFAADAEVNRVRLVEKGLELLKGERL